MGYGFDCGCIAPHFSDVGSEDFLLFRDATDGWREAFFCRSVSIRTTIDDEWYYAVLLTHGDEGLHLFVDPFALRRIRRTDDDKVPRSRKGIVYLLWQVARIEFRGVAEYGSYLAWQISTPIEVRGQLVML